MIGTQAFRHVSWVTAAFGAQQVLRLLTNVVLALIVSPAVFGVMLVLNTLRTGTEQITDVGIGQNIVFDPMGNRPRFYNSAWTVQIIRGFLLFGIFLAASPLLADAFGGEELERLLPLFAVIFIISGFATPSKFLLQKRHLVKKQVVLDLVVVVIGSVLALAFALISPTAEALVWALLATTLIGALIAARLMNWRNLRITLDKKMSRRIVSFGKWVFVASLFYFAATSFDRLYFASVIPLSLLGVYAIARTFSEAAFNLAHKLSTLIVFPKIAQMHNAGITLDTILKPRLYGVLIAGGFIGTAISLSDLLIEILYDDRYILASAILPILLVGTWFSILSILNESMVYGSGKPAINAGANAAKLVWLFASVPPAYNTFGLGAALLAIAAADLPRYLFLSALQPGSRTRFLLQDILATLVMLSVALLLRSLLVAAGLAQSFLPSTFGELEFF